MVKTRVAKTSPEVTIIDTSSKRVQKKKVLNVKKKASQTKYKSEALVRELLDKKFNDGNTVRYHKKEIIEIIGAENYKRFAPVIQQKLKDMARGKSGTKEITKKKSYKA